MEIEEDLATAAFCLYVQILSRSKFWRKLCPNI